MNTAFRTLRLLDLLESEPTNGTRQDESAKATIPWVSSTLVNNAHEILRTAPSERTNGDVGDRLTRRHDLLLVGRGFDRDSLARCARVDFDESAAFADSLIRLRIDSTVAEPEYVRLYLTSRKGSAALVAAATGNMISNLSRRALQEVEVSVPSLEDQRLIARYMTTLDEKIDDISQTLRVLRELQDTAREALTSGSITVSRSGDRLMKTHDLPKAEAQG
jgi:type I restriction enzyme S subunit